MKTLRIFISSPGDVAEERDRARQVVEGLRRRYAGRLNLKPFLWEDLPLQPDMSFQQGIDLVLSADHGIDIGVFILWSRLGSLQDGSKYRSGTEREFDLMLEARRQSGGVRPSLLVYTRSDDASFGERLRGKSTIEQRDLILQKAMAEQFISEKFQDATTGRNLRAHHSFDRPVTFSQRLRAHLTELLDELAGGDITEAVWDIEKQGAPFLGLEAFQPQHADVFFGRETETLEARHALREQARNGCAFLLLSGASGSGKSSLARAGVLPAIVENELDEQVTAWRTVIATPLELGTDPLTGLVRRLAADEVLPELRGDADALDDLIDGMRRDPALTHRLRVKDAFAQAGKRHGGSVRVLLVLDQLEELFATAAVSDTARQDFLEAVEALARSGQIWVLTTVRSDFWAQVQAQPALVRMTEGRGLQPVLPPETDSLRRLIEEPARLAGLTFEQREGQSLADRILRDAAAHAELLPLLEYVLRELFEQRTAQRLLTWETYEKLGGVEGALAKRAEDVFKALPGDAQEALGSVLKALVTIGQEGSEGASDQIVRQRVPLTSLTNNAGAATLVRAFVQERLLTTSDDPATGEAAVTVAHESLLRVWPRAIAWAEHNREFLRTRARIAARILEGSPLLMGDPLMEAAKFHLTGDRDSFTEEQRGFVSYSLDTALAAHSRQVRTRRLVLAGLVFLTLASLTVGAAAFWQWKRADAESEQRRAALAESQRQLQRADDAARAEKRSNAIAQAARRRSDNTARQLEESTIKQQAALRRDVYRRFCLLEYLGLRSGGEGKQKQRKETSHLLEDGLSEDAVAAGLAFLTKEGEIIRKIHEEKGSMQILPEILRSHAVTIWLTLNSESMDAEERQYWFDTMPVMDESQKAKLLSILLKERIQLEELDLKYEREVDDLNETSLREVSDKSVANARERLGRDQSPVNMLKMADALLLPGQDLIEAIEALKLLQTFTEQSPSSESQRLRSLQLKAYLRTGEKTAASAFLSDPISFTWSDFSKSDLKEARGVLERSLEHQRELAEADPGLAQTHGLAVIYQRLGEVTEAEGDIEVAREAYEKCLKIRLPLTEADPANSQAQRNVSIILDGLARLASKAGEMTPAMDACGKALVIRTRLAHSQPDNAEWHQELSVNHGNLGDLLRKKGDFPTARASYDSSLAIVERLAGATPANLELQRSLALTLGKIADLAGAEKDYARAIAMTKKRIGAQEKLLRDDSELAGLYLNLSWYLIFQKDFLGAQGAAEKGISIKSDYYPLYTNLAHSLLFQGKYASAAEVYGKHKDAEMGGETWSEVIADDFRQFREAKLIHPDMKKVEALLSVAQPAKK